MSDPCISSCAHKSHRAVRIHPAVGVANQLVESPVCGAMKTFSAVDRAPISPSELARGTLPSAISRKAVTISRLSVSRSDFAPLKSRFALFEASTTSSNRLGIFSKQSSTVMRAINFAPKGYRNISPFSR